MRGRLVIPLLVSLVLFGCSSMQSTAVRDPRNGATGDGFPVVIQRPRYLRVTEREIDKKLILSTSSGEVSPGPVGPGMDDGPVSPGGKGTVDAKAAEGLFKTTTIEYEVVSVGEIFLVDVRRPAAGTAEFTFEFEPNAQYPKKVTGKSEDKTLEAAGSAIGSLLEKVGKVFKPTSGTLALPSGATTVDVASRVKKVTLYDLDRLAEANYAGVVIYEAPKEAR
jgi:hypothetical protein